MQIHPLDERIRELCAKAATVADAEIPALFAELNALLAEHSEYVRYLAAKTLSRANKSPSSLNTAD